MEYIININYLIIYDVILEVIKLKKIREECSMENVYSQIDVNAYVAKYMDETGCNLNEACEELGIDPSKVFSFSSEEDDDMW